MDGSVKIVTARVIAVCGKELIPRRMDFCQDSLSFFDVFKKIVGTQTFPSLYATNADILAHPQWIKAFFDDKKHDALQ